MRTPETDSTTIEETTYTLCTENEEILLLTRIAEMQHEIDAKLEELLIKFKELETLAESIKTRS